MIRRSKAKSTTLQYGWHQLNKMLDWQLLWDSDFLIFSQYYSPVQKYKEIKTVLKLFEQLGIEYQSVRSHSGVKKKNLECISRVNIT